MRAHILSTGNEVLWGDVDDTNASWLSRQLRASGIDVVRISCVGDDIDDISGIMKEIATSSLPFPVDVVVVTGGLGPTSDDLSAEAAALATHDPVALNQDAYDSMKRYFEEKGWPMPESNTKQAMLPSKAGLMINTCGTAPGFHVTCNETLFYFMPGVPREMRAMFELSVLPHIKERFQLDTSFLMRRFKLFGLPESKVSRALDGFDDVFPEFTLGFRASFPLIEVKFSLSVPALPEQGGDVEKDMEKIDEVGDPSQSDNPSKGVGGENATNADTRMAAAEKWVGDRLEGYIFSRDGLNMEAAVGALLSQTGKTVAVAESCTGGLIANMLTDVAGSSDYFLLSAVTYSNDAKINVLGVDPMTIETHGAVHETTVEEMARGVRDVAGADYGLATSGIAGPGGGTEEKPVGTICIGLAGEDFVLSHRFRYNFDSRAMNKKMFAVKALDLLRRQLMDPAQNNP